MPLKLIIAKKVFVQKPIVVSKKELNILRETLYRMFK